MQTAVHFQYFTFGATVALQCGGMEGRIADMKSDFRRWLTIVGITGCACIVLSAQTSPPAPADQAPHAWRKADSTATAQYPGPAESQNSAQPGFDNQAPAAEPNQAGAQAWPDPQVPEAQAQQPPEGAYPPVQGQAAPEQAPPPAQGAPPQGYPPANQGAYPPQQPSPQQFPQQGYPPASQQGAYPPQPPYNPGAPYGNSSIPATLTIAPGTYITARTNGWLSSDHNQPGDAFTATLAEPLIINGIVVAQRGQTVGGVVTEAKKAGRVEGTSSLGIKLTNLTLTDGQTVNIDTSMINRVGDTSVGRDAAAIGTTTGLGAIIGAGADWGRGAAIGAGAGAAAGIIGVLLTRGRPTVIYPETAMTFRVNDPVTIDTTHAPQAFRYADQSDYGRPAYAQGVPPARMAAPCYGCAAPVPAPYYGPAYYPVPYYAPYPYYWGPAFSLYVGRGYYPGTYFGRVWIRR
jgi:hypothetical protein